MDPHPHHVVARVKLVRLPRHDRLGLLHPQDIQLRLQRGKGEGYRRPIPLWLKCDVGAIFLLLNAQSSRNPQVKVNDFGHAGVIAPVIFSNGWTLRLLGQWPVDQV